MIRHGNKLVNGDVRRHAGVWFHGDEFFRVRFRQPLRGVRVAGESGEQSILGEQMAFAFTRGGDDVEAEPQEHQGGARRHGLRADDTRAPGEAAEQRVERGIQNVRGETLNERVRAMQQGYMLGGDRLERDFEPRGATEGFAGGRFEARQIGLQDGFFIYHRAGKREGGAKEIGDFRRCVPNLRKMCDLLMIKNKSKIFAAQRGGEKLPALGMKRSNGGGPGGQGHRLITGGK